MDWTHILAYVTRTVDQQLLARNEYLAAENRILKSKLNGRLKLSDAERAMLGKIGHRLGRQTLAEVATVASPDTILAWYRKLIAGKFDGSKARRGPGRPRVTWQVEQLIVRMASENRDLGYDRIVGALANRGYVISDQTVGNMLHRHALPPSRRALSEYVEHYHAERNHQGKDNVLLFPRDTSVRRTGPVQCRERLGGLLRYYHEEAAWSPAQ
jgi:putative transposase